MLSIGSDCCIVQTANSGYEKRGTLRGRRAINHAARVFAPLNFFRGRSIIAVSQRLNARARSATNKTSETARSLLEGWELARFVSLKILKQTLLAQGVKQHNVTSAAVSSIPAPMQKKLGEARRQCVVLLEREKMPQANERTAAPSQFIEENCGTINCE